MLVIVDLLAEVMATIGVRGTVAARLDAAEPWGLLLDQVPGAAFHAVTTGTAWLVVPDREPLHLTPGDVVLLAGGAAHGLASTPDADMLPFDHVAAQQAFAVGGVMSIGYGPVRTRILCASYRHHPAVNTPLLSLLPEVMWLAGGTGHRDIEDTLRLMTTELADPAVGTSTVLDRLVDILFIQLVRAWLREHSEIGRPSWLRGLTDPVVAAALTAMHTQPERRWALDSLARHIGVSRATLSRRFADRVGESPGTYLTRWRMDVAARLLRDTDDPLEHIARSVGYTSEYAFSRTFSRSLGLPPGRYRRDIQQTRK
jgi:AraC-like DNA-binding protein